MSGRLTAVIFGTALVLGGLALPAIPGTAAAITMQVNLSNVAPPSALEAGSVQKVAQKSRRQRRATRRLRYDRRRHGDRHRYRRGRHKHYYGGYWYAFPWWLGVPYYGTPYYDPYYDAAPRHSAHVEWCLRRYRSYNPRTDTFRGYDGLDHRCRSPYRR